MGIRGTKPKPTHLKLVTGNPGKRALNENEPVATGEPVKPRFLKGRASKLWDEYAPQLVAMGVLKAVDAHMFAVWCVLAAELEKDPAAMTASRISQMRALASSFGLDASARSRMMVGNGNPNTPPQREEEAGKYFAHT